MKYNEIKKLTNKIKNLKSELKKSQEREKKCNFTLLSNRSRYPEKIKPQTFELNDRI